MDNELYKYIKCFEDFKRVLKISISNTEKLIKIKYDQSLVITDNTEDLITYLKDEKRKLLKVITLNSNLKRVYINEVNVIVNEDDLNDLIEFVKNQFFEKEQNRYSISKENTKYLTKCFNDVANSIWIAFYNNIINELKNGSNFRTEKEFYPFKELKNYNTFCTYVADNIIEPYIDFSYLFQRLLHQKLMFPITQKEFFKWLLNNDFITKKNYELFDVKGQFYSLIKSTTPERENKFNNLFKL
jgi:hypothetical protein